MCQTVYTGYIPYGAAFDAYSGTMFAYQIPYMGAHSGGYPTLSSPLGLESFWGRAGGLEGLVLADLDVLELDAGVDAGEVVV